MSHKISLACAGAFAAAATLAGIGPALSHTIVGKRVFPATLDIDDPGVNDELSLPMFTYIANPDNSNEYDFNGFFQKTIFYNLSFSIADTFSHNTHTALFTNPVTGVTTFGTLNGWKNLRTQLKYVPYQNDEHEFIVAVAFAQEWGHTGNLSLGVDRFTALTAKGFVGKGFGDVEADWLKPVAITGEVDYNWSTHPIDFAFDPTTGLTVSRTPTVLTYGATLQYSLLYMNSFVHEVPEFFRQLIPDFEVSFSTRVSNIGPSVPNAKPGTHETTGVYGPGLYYLGRLGPIAFELGGVAQIPINGGSARHVGWSAILDFFLDDIFPDTLGKPLFGPAQPRAAGLGY